MKLSVLIPCYNYDCTTLVSAMREQCVEWGGAFEIVVGDDASPDQHIAQRLSSLQSLPQVRVIRHGQNLGRAYCLNALAELAVGEWLLIVDCDAVVPADFSILRYMEAAERAEVVCGGLRHPEQNPNPAATLRYKYERKADRRRAAILRNEHPYDQLSTFNLLVRRDVFMSIRFDADCHEYGYEDTLFGAELERHGHSLLHVDNALVHVGLEANDIFLKKTETALHTLQGLQGKMHGHSGVLNMVSRLRRWHLAGVVRRVYHFLRSPIRRNLLGRHPSLFLFNLYKLGYFLELSSC